jgi:hypothetical protein
MAATVFALKRRHRRQFLQLQNNNKADVELQRVSKLSFFNYCNSCLNSSQADLTFFVVVGPTKHSFLLSILFLLLFNTAKRWWKLACKHSRDFFSYVTTS